MKRFNLHSGVASATLLALALPLFAACGGPANTTAPATTAPAASAAAEAPATTEAPAAATEAPAAATEAPVAPVAGALTGKVLRIQQISTPDVLDPQKSSVSNEIALLELNYEGLTKLDDSLKPAPAAAEKWEFNEAGDQITFTLHDGLKYSDGSALTSKDFAYSIERTCDPATAGEYQAILFEIVGCQDFASAPMTDTAALEAGRTKLTTEGVQTPDDKTLVLKLTNPAPYYPYIAGLWVMYPAKKDLIAAGGEAWWKDPTKQIGNGPFQIVTYDEGQLAAFKANENYWSGKPKLDGIEFIYQGDTSVALEAYKAGQLDIIQPDSTQLPAIKEDTVLSNELKIYPGANTYAWGFNLKIAPFEDKKVREAFAYAFDRDTFCETLRNGDCVAAYSWLPTDLAGAITDQPYKFDPEKAKQALAESTYGSADKLPEIKLSYNADDPAVTPRIEWLAGQLRDILGVNATLDPQEGKAINAARKDNATYPQVCLFCTNWFQDYPDAQNWLTTYWNSEAFAKRIGYSSPELDALMKQGDVELDQAKRVELIKQAGQMLIDDLPSPFAYSNANVFLVKPEVTGYKTTSADSEFPGQWGSLLTLDVSR
ncbi:peptide ABC transporter substrate-binding protein [Chloroflexia bacterium SDU3-3]|nr:peptide ABC transporter substrate-binding protein [Chloroflexia bacterium SDU3-3]